MKVTIAVCAWNWAESLDRTLESFERLKTPEKTVVQFLVVNNNCTDSTDAVIAKHSNKIPLIRLFEPKQGLSHARNCAVAASIGELIIFTDQDAIVHPDWLSSYVEAYHRWPEASYFGGIINPMFESEPPRWVLTHLQLLEGAILIRNLGNQERRLGSHEQVFGANIAFKKSIFNEFHFDPNFGPAGKNLILGDETHLVNQLVKRNHFGIWVPSAKVQHYVPKKRTTIKFIRRYFFAQGRTLIRSGNAPNGTQIFGVPRPLLRQWLEAFSKAYFFRLVRSQRWFRYLLTASELQGKIYECYRPKQSIVSSR